MDRLFYELVRVSIGTQDSLSRIPSGQEWAALYDMARKQCLSGICFTAAQAMSSFDAEYYAGMSEDLYLDWMSDTAEIQRDNHKADRRCMKLQEKFRREGLRSCVLKGQGVAAMYDGLRELRQSGDIDLWVDAPRECVLECAGKLAPVEDAGELHASLELFPDMAVEIHFTPSIASARRTNIHLQAWFEAMKPSCFGNDPIRLGDGAAIVAPPVEFNLVYLMHHIFRHYLYEGIGLRQIMDYYFVLKHSTIQQRTAAMDTLRELGMSGFAGAMMWLLCEVLGMESSLALCPLDERRGRRLLEVIEEGGNFGQSTLKYKVTGWDKPLSRISRYIRRNSLMILDYPSEVLGNVAKRLGFGKSSLFV